jgi:hypothetical protein
MNYEIIHAYFLKTYTPNIESITYMDYLDHGFPRTTVKLLNTKRLTLKPVL